MQIWEVVEYTLTKVSELLELLNSTLNGGRESKCVFYIASYIGIIDVSFGANIVNIMILNANAPLKLNYIS